MKTSFARGRDSNLRPSGYELQKVTLIRANWAILALEEAWFGVVFGQFGTQSGTPQEWYSAGTPPISLLRVMPPTDPIPAAALIVCEQRGEAYYEAKFRFGGRQVKRRIGPAWLTPDGSGGWVPRRGRVADGWFDERHAHVAAAEIVRTYVTDVNERERVERERRTRGVTFRELAHGYLEWLEVVRGAKPSTIRSHQSDLAEPGAPHKRGKGTTAGHIMAALGDKPAAKITPAEVEALLRTVAATGVSARSVNRTREIVCAAFNYGMKPTTYSLPTNPALGTDRRRVPEPGVLLFYSPEEIEAVARSLDAGFHRPAVSARDELQLFEDRRDSEAVRVPPTPVCASASSWPCAGAMSTGPDRP